MYTNCNIARVVHAWTSATRTPWFEKEIGRLKGAYRDIFAQDGLEQRVQGRRVGDECISRDGGRDEPSIMGLCIGILIAERC